MSTAAIPDRLRLRRRLGATLAAALIMISATAGARPFPDRFDLPDGFLPEGIAIGPGPVAWFGSRADGDIYRANLITGGGDVISQGPGTPSVGLKIDRRERLFVAGGPSGTGRVVQTDSGKILADYQFTTEPSFINDVLLTRHSAWFTNSMAAELYAVPLGHKHDLSQPARTVPLGGAWEQGEGFGANGITTTPDGRALLVVHSTSGLLYRVDPATGVAVVVDLGGTSLVNGDGMLLRGRTLYVVQNQLNQIAVIRLDRAGDSGELVGTITDPDFDVPTTVAAFGTRLYLPNARFTTEQTPQTKFWVTAVRQQT
ncbi:MAG TPA: superoxide dismutase [Microlunatus sp.]